MRISDWSADVCSSDLDETHILIGLLGLGTAQPRQSAMHPERQRLWKIATQLALLGLPVLMVQRAAGRIAIDRKSVVSGTRLSIRVELGGRRRIKQQKNDIPKTTATHTTTKHNI